MSYYTDYNSPIGRLLLVSDGVGLSGLWLENTYSLAQNGLYDENLPIFIKTKQWLDEYFKGNQPDIKQINLAPQGSEFGRQIWQILLEIPYGQVVTYGQIAKIVAQKNGITKMSAQAVGGAVGRNPISIIIPCHRVVGANGNLTGYAGGLDTKIKLLKLEGVDMSKMYLPTKSLAL